MSYSPFANPLQFLLAVGLWAVLLFYVWPRLLAVVKAASSQSFGWFLDVTVGRLFPNRHRPASKSLAEEYREELDDPDLMGSEEGLFVPGLVLCSIAAWSVYVWMI